MSINNLNTYLNIKDSHLRVVSGNVYAQAMNIGGINIETAHGLQSVSNTGNVTSNTLQFSNAITGFVTTANAQIGRDLIVSGNATVSTDLTVSANATVSTDLTVSANATVADTLTISEHLIASKEATVTGNLHVTTIRSDSNVVTEYTGPHDRPLRKYPEVALTANDNSSTSGYVASGSTRLNASYEYYEAFDLKTNLTDDNTANTGIYGAWLSSDSRFDSNGDADLTTSNTFPGTSYRGEYCALKLPNAIKLDNFHIFPRGDASSYANSQAPKDLRIFGSNDGTTWTHIKQFQNLSFTGRTGLRLHVNDSNTYNEYAFFVEKITIVSGGARYCAISGIELYGHEEGSGSLDTTLKSVYNVPATTGTQLEVYYDAKDLDNGNAPTNPVDLSPNTNNATLGGDPQVSNGAFVFDGTGDYITGTHGLSVPGQPVHSQCVWFKITGDTSDYQYISIIGTTNSTNQAGLVLLNDGTTLLGNYYGGDRVITTITQNVWYHAVLVYTGTTTEAAKYYINGVEVITTGLSGAAPITPTITGTTVRLGANTSGGQELNGSIANFRLFSKALNADQIKELYDYQKDYFLGSKSQVTLYKGHLGVGVTEPSGQLELAGDERIQEYPPRGMTHSDGTVSQTEGKTKNITYIEGHGEFKASASKWSVGVTGYDGQQPYNAFDDTPNKRWLMYENVGYNATTGAYEDNEYQLSASSGTPYGHWLKLEMPYKVNIRNYYMKANNTSHGAKDWQVWASNDDNNWTHIHSYTNETSANSFAGSYYNVSHTGHYKMFAIIVTRIFNASTQDRIDIFRVKYFGTPGPTILDKGSLSLTRSLDVPRISRYDVDTETPRPEKLVVDFDTTVNSSPTDISGKGNHGTLVGATYSPADKAFTFNGTDQYIKFDTGLTGNAIFSVSMWFISTGAGVDTLFQINGDYTATSGELAWLYKSGNELFFDFHNNNLKVDYSLFNNNGWNHVVVTFDGNATTGRCIYANGVKLTGTLDGSSSGTALSLTNNTQAVIGALHRTSQNDYIHEIVGKISNFKLYSVALEPSEVQKLYRLGRTGRSMVISDTAVGIGKVPEAQLDVRGNLNVSSFIKYDSAWFYAYDGDTSGSGTFEDYTGFVPWNLLKPGSKHFTTASASTSGGYYTAPVDGIYHFDTSVLNFPDARTPGGDDYSGIFFSVNGDTTGTDGTAYGYFRKTPARQESISTSSTFRLDEGDIVKVHIDRMDCYTQSQHAFFSGYLVTRI